MLITRGHGSWVVLGTLVTDRELAATAPLDAGCGECRLCIDACPTAALDEPGTLDATKCLSYWLQAPAAIPEEYRAAVGAQVYGCDICQDVCPWNRGVRKRRDGAPSDAGHVDLVAWLEQRRPGADRRIRAALRAAQRPSLAPAQRARRARQRRRPRARAGPLGDRGGRRRDRARARRMGARLGSAHEHETAAAARVVDQHHPARRGSVRAAPGVADRRDPVTRPSGRLGRDRAARGRWRPCCSR